MNKIAIIGAGYVGLVTGTCFANKNNQVIIVEKDQERIKALLDGKIPFYEPGLDQLVKQCIIKKTITFVDHIKKALPEKPEIIFSCVGTPSLVEDGSADLSYVWNVAQEIGQHISEYTLVVNKSTVPVGTAKKVKKIILQELEKRNLTVQFDVASNPEFLKEGDALNDFLYPDRIVIGTESKKAIMLLEKLYKPFIKNKEQFIVTNIASAELTKYAANTMLATRISFMNEMALLADKVGADIEQIKKGIGRDKRIGSYFLNAGIGYGGSCFPKDVKALIHTGKQHGQPMTLVQAVDSANDTIRNLFFKNILASYNNNIKNKTFGIWGLAFKPETDDIRGAPSIDIIKNLLKYGANIRAYDPVAQENMKKLFGQKVIFCSQAHDAIKDIDALIILTEWKELKQFPLQDLSILKGKIIFDGRNCFVPKEITKLGIMYKTIGRNILTQKTQSIRKTSKKQTLTKDSKSYHYAT